MRSASALALSLVASACAPALILVASASALARILLRWFLHQPEYHTLGITFCFFNSGIGSALRYFHILLRFHDLFCISAIAVSFPRLAFVPARYVVSGKSFVAPRRSSCQSAFSLKFQEENDIADQGINSIYIIIVKHCLNMFFAELWSSLRVLKEADHITVLRRVPEIVADSRFQHLAYEVSPYFKTGDYFWRLGCRYVNDLRHIKIKGETVFTAHCNRR